HRHRGTGGRLLYRLQCAQYPRQERRPLTGARGAASARVAHQRPGLDGTPCHPTPPDRAQDRSGRRRDSVNGSTQALWTVSGIVEAPVEHVSRLLCTVRPGRADEHNGLVVSLEGPPEHGAITLTGGPQRFVASITEPATTFDVEVDQEHHRLAVQGHFWYRG